ncbi:MAG: hypothetical protein H0X29_09330 [Parachlamydiaceae bacterium]|nr:hypothetical protein [Parachlamydiaceae bacterium]
MVIIKQDSLRQQWTQGVGLVGGMVCVIGIGIEYGLGIDRGICERFNDGNDITIGTIKMFHSIAISRGELDPTR